MGTAAQIARRAEMLHKVAILRRWTQIAGGERRCRKDSNLSTRRLSENPLIQNAEVSIPLQGNENHEKKIPRSDDCSGMAMYPAVRYQSLKQLSHD